MGYNRSYPFINWQGSTTRLPIDKGCNRLDTGPRRCIISVSLFFFLFLAEMALCCLQFMDDMSTWKIFYTPCLYPYIYWMVVPNIFHFHHYLGKTSNFLEIFQMGWDHQPVYHLYSMIIRGYTQHSISSAPNSCVGSVDFPEAKTAANVDMAFLTAAQNLVEMRRLRRRSRQGWMKRDPWGPGYCFSLGIVLINGMKVKHGR